MAWNNSYALKILADMPTNLSAKNLELLQSEIDKDKLATSIEMNRDLCGDYAPFCVFCNKKSAYPCAVALVKCKQAEGLQLEIAVSDGEAAAPDVQTAKPEEAEAETVGNAVDEAANVPAGGGPENTGGEEPKAETASGRIRIAVAKRKHR